MAWSVSGGTVYTPGTTTTTGGFYLSPDWDDWNSVYNGTETRPEPKVETISYQDQLAIKDY